jgi:hypothetical protein
MSLVTLSCDELIVTPGPGPLVTAKDNVSNVENPEEIDFSNPGVFVGTDFGNYFQSMFRRGEFDEMIKFTSKESLDKFGEDAVRDFYEHDLQFGYELGDAKSQNIKDGITTLNYSANINATKVVVRINVVVENDSCKVLIHQNLKDFPLKF